MQCPKCKTKLTKTQIERWGHEPKPRNSYCCSQCEGIICEFTVLGTDPLLVNLADRPPEMAMLEWLRSELLKR